MESALVKRPRDHSSDVTRSLIAGDKCAQYVDARALLGLADRQRRRQDRHRGMTDQRMNVVIIERMRGCTIDQRSRLPGGSIVDCRPVKTAPRSV